MSKKEDRNKKQIERQNEAVLKEAEAAGARLVDKLYVELKDEQGNEKIEAVKKNIKLFTGGKFATTSLQTFNFTSSIGEHTYVQPFSDELPLPGEHHIVVPGSYDASFSVVPSVWQRHSMLKIYILLAVFSLGLFLALGLRKPKIISADKALAKKLNKDRSFRAIFKGMKSNWAMGLTEMELEWTMQVRPLGNGMSHIVMYSGRYGGFTTYKVGFTKFQQICAALQARMPMGSAPCREFVTEPKYGDLAMGFAERKLSLGGI